MGIDSTRTSWGYYLQATSGTGTTLVNFLPKGNWVQVVGCAVYGSATTGIGALADADGNIIYKDKAAAAFSSSCLNMSNPIRVDGLSAYISGTSAATAGNAFMQVYLT